MAEDEESTSTTVKTRVPAEQKDIWQDHAEELGMSQSEFVRTMVQAGRRGLDPERLEHQSEHSNPRGNAYEKAICDAVTNEPRPVDEIVEEILQEKQEEIHHTVETLVERGALGTRRDLYYLANGEAHVE